MIVGVIGSGSIGPDLAYGFLSALAAGEGGKVYLLDIKKEALDAGVGRIEDISTSVVARKLARRPPKRPAALIPDGYHDLAGCDYTSRLQQKNLKQKIILRNLDRLSVPTA
jgi:enoyl-CoA hydratase/3-hydroxyacyl-CoA dehydrogenase